MPYLDFVTLDVFTTTKFAGNPLAVVKIPKDKAQDVSTEQMQAIAREFNLSETIFLFENDGPETEWRVRIFLTTAEIPFAGHPTIGCAVYALGTLANNAPKGRLIANAGPIDLDFANGVAQASIPHNFHRHTQYPCTPEDIYALQPSLSSTNENLQPSSINLLSPVKGMNFIAVHLSDLDHITTSSSRPTPRLDDDWNVGFCGMLFCKSTPSPTRSHWDIQARMIAGPIEDPATGSAACALACHLTLLYPQNRITTFAITQGVEMGRKSDIGVKITLNKSLNAIEKVVLSGSAVKVMEGRVEY